MTAPIFIPCACRTMDCRECSNRGEPPFALPKPVKRVKSPKRLRRSALPRRTSPLPKGKGRIKTRRPVGTKRREAKAAGYVDPLTWLAVVEFYRGLCAYCEERAWRDPDHVYPVSKGGPDVIENLVPCCRPCNLAKGQSTRWQPKRVHPYVTLVDYRRTKGINGHGRQMYSCWIHVKVQCRCPQNHQTIRTNESCPECNRPSPQPYEPDFSGGGGDFGGGGASGDF